MGGGYSPYPPFIHILFNFKENNTKGGGGHPIELLCDPISVELSCVIAWKPCC